ncbi:MAG: glycosyltransferase [Abditibacteriaceae bacterium]
MPKISLLSVAYNAERYIGEMINSVISQTFQDFEFIIFDDASTDSTVQIAGSFDDPRIRVLSGTLNRGQSGCIPELADVVSGKYIGWVDADDMLTAHTLESTNWVLDQYPQYGLVYTDHHEMDEQSRITHVGTRSQYPYSRDNLLLHFMSFHFRLFRHELYARIEPLNPAYRVAQDYEFCLKMSEITDFIHLPLALYKYRAHVESLSNQKYKLQSEVCLQLIRDALARRGLTRTQVQLYYKNGQAKYRFMMKVEENTPQSQFGNDSLDICN